MSRHAIFLAALRTGDDAPEGALDGSPVSLLLGLVVAVADPEDSVPQNQAGPSDEGKDSGHRRDGRARVVPRAYVIEAPNVRGPQPDEYGEDRATNRGAEKVRGFEEVLDGASVYPVHRRRGDTCA